MVFTRTIPQWLILLLRIIMAVGIFVLLTGIFAEMMRARNCTFPYRSYVAGTVISELALGSTGLFTAVLSNSVLAGYSVFIGYFLLHYLGTLSDTNIFYLFRVGTGRFGTKAWLFGISIVWIMIALIYEKKKKID